MGFFATNQTATKGDGSPSKEFLYKNECRACPLHHVHNRSPKLLPSGSKEPLILFLGDSLRADEDAKGEQFSGSLLRPLIPKKFEPYIRWDNTVRCMPPNERPPNDIELSCCLPRHLEDLNLTQPFAIFGFGNIPLQWALNQTGIMKWRGRYAPVSLGGNTFWYFPFIHPSALLRQRKGNSRHGSEDEFTTKLDLARAFELVESLDAPVAHTVEDASYGIRCITGQNKGDVQEVIRFLAYAETKKYAGFDYETQGLRPYGKDARILTIAVSVGDETLAFAFEHPQAGWSPSQLELVWQSLVEFIEAPVAKVVHNLSFEEEWTAFHFGKDKLRKTRWEDTIVQAFVLDERPNSFSLEFLSIQYFGLNLKEISRQLDKTKLHLEPLEQVLHYNGLDAKYHLLLYLKQRQRIVAEKLQHVYEMQLRRIPTLVLTQMKGLSVDFKVNKELGEKFTAKIKAASAKIEQDADVKAFQKQLGKQFNPGSPRDVEILLKDIIKTRIGLKDTGRYTTDEDILNQVDRPIAKLVLEYRKASKAYSTYIEPFDKNSDKTVVHYDGLVHTSYNSIFTSTGRLSSDGPNLQNQPKRDSNLKEVRTQFIPGE